MKNLQPLDAYTEDIAALWRRQGQIVGVAFGTVMALATPLMVSPDVGAGRLVVSAFLAFVAGGPLFGFVWSRWMARSMRAMTEAVYAGISPFAVEVPSGEFGYRLPASLRTSDRFAVGGVIFLGRGAMAFVPHGRNLPSHRHPVNMPVDREFNVELVPQRSTVLRRLMFGALPELVRVTSHGTGWLFLVPRPEATAKKIHDVVTG